MSVHRFTESDAAQSAAACARHILAQLEHSLSGNDVATFAVSGGASPRPVLEHLAAAGFNWSRVHLFWVDERCVPPMHPQSNFRMVDRTFVIPSRLPRRNVHRVYTELMPDRAAERYAEDIRDLFDIAPGQIPHFDLIQLGMGADAHTASLFPGDPSVADRESITRAIYVEKLNQWRVTLMPAVLLAARHTVVFAPGEEKAEATRAVLEDEFDANRLPAQIPAHLARGVAWFMDTAAASRLSGFA